MNIEDVIEPIRDVLQGVAVFDSKGKFIASWNQCNVDKFELEKLATVTNVVSRFFQARGDREPGFLFVFEQGVGLVKKLENGILFTVFASQEELPAAIRKIEDMELQFVRFIDFQQAAMLGLEQPPLLSEHNLARLKSDIIAFLRKSVGPKLLNRLAPLIKDMRVEDDFTHWDMLIEHIGALIEREFGPVFAKGVKRTIRDMLSHYLAMESS